MTMKSTMRDGKLAQALGAVLPLSLQQGVCSHPNFWTHRNPSSHSIFRSHPIGNLGFWSIIFCLATVLCVTTLYTMWCCKQIPFWLFIVYNRHLQVWYAKKQTSQFQYSLHWYNPVRKMTREKMVSQSESRRLHSTNWAYFSARRAFRQWAKQYSIARGTPK
jgi:hypothetical protein